MIGFHRFLIGTAILFCAVFAAWSLNVFRQAGGTLTLLLGLAFAAATLALGYYLRHLERFLWRRR
jgi:hypothetical protein